LAYQSLADATPRVLLIVSVGVHFAMSGVGLLFCVAEGFRNPSLWDLRLSLGALTLAGQAVIIIATSGAPIVLLCFFLNARFTARRCAPRR
jgi:branched-chain amino acid transport system permease protein